MSFHAGVSAWVYIRIMMKIACKVVTVEKTMKINCVERVMYYQSLKIKFPAPHWFYKVFLITIWYIFVALVYCKYIVLFKTASWNSCRSIMTKKKDNKIVFFTEYWCQDFDLLWKFLCGAYMCGLQSIERCEYIIRKYEIVCDSWRSKNSVFNVL